MSNTTPVSSDTPSQGGWPGEPPGPRGAGRTIHAFRARLQRGPGAPLSGDAAGTELDAHPRAHRLRRLRDAVLPGALTGSAHDDEVAMAQGEAHALPAPDRTQHQ